MKFSKPWIPEIFNEYHWPCVATKTPIKRKTAAVVVCGFEVFSRVLNFIVTSLEHNYFRIKFKFSWFSEFHSNNKVYCIFFEKSIVQIPESLHFLLLWRGLPFPVRDHLRSGDHLRACPLLRSLFCNADVTMTPCIVGSRTLHLSLPDNGVFSHLFSYAPQKRSENHSLNGKRSSFFI